jgi:SEL1 protein
MTLNEWLYAFLEAELARWDDLEGEDYDYDDTMLGEGEGFLLDEITDSALLESAIILGLTGVLAFLLWYRTYRQRQQEEERRRQQQLQQGQAHAQAPGGQQPPPAQPQPPPQQDRGLFPQPGDPAFMDWAVGGVGH